MSENQNPCTACADKDAQLVANAEEISKQVAELGQKDARIAELEAEIADQDEEIEKLNQIIGNANTTTPEKAVAKAEKPTTPTEPLTVGEKSYQWKRPTFKLAGDPTVHVSAEAATNSKLIARLLAVKGQKVLVEQA